MKTAAEIAPAENINAGRKYDFMMSVLPLPPLQEANWLLGARLSKGKARFSTHTTKN
jgi:hypothetical protein